LLKNNEIQRNERVCTLERKRNKLTYREMDRQTSRQIDKQAERQTLRAEGERKSKKLNVMNLARDC
jgi:hypothetical protein